MKVHQTTSICPRLKPVQLPLVGKCLSINSATRIFRRKAMMTGISSVRSWVIVTCSLIPRAYLNSYFLAKIRTNCEYRDTYPQQWPYSPQSQCHCRAIQSETKRETHHSLLSFSLNLSEFVAA